MLLIKMLTLVTILLTLSTAAAFIHPGALHTTQDFARINTHLANNNEPWNTSYTLLTTSPYAQPTYLPTPQETIYRGANANSANPENYQYLYKDAAAAYQLALRWKLTNDTAFASAATNILSSWALTLTAIDGSSDKYLASGLYGYQLANAAELMRDYPGWDGANKTATAGMLTDVFAAMNTRFLEDHNDTHDGFHYWANWDQCNLASLILTFIDRRTKRKLINQDQYIERLRSELPHVEIKIVDFATLTFQKQLRIVQDTDILIGVHGAGLTHGMFLQPGSTVVEILPPDLGHKGFRNLANQMGHRYFSTHGTGNIPSSERSNWQEDDVFIEEDRFVELVRVAAASMYHRGSLGLDVN